MNRTSSSWLAMLAMVSYAIVSVIILVGQNKLEDKLQAKNDQLWLQLKDQTVETIKAQGKAESLRIELEELQTRTSSLFDAQVLTPSEKKKKK